MGLFAACFIPPTFPAALREARGPRARLRSSCLRSCAVENARYVYRMQPRVAEQLPHDSRSPPREKDIAAAAASSGIHRRGFLSRMLRPTLALLVINESKQKPARASSVATESAASSAREGIAGVVARVPGYGQPDVYYPSQFEGVWNLTRELYRVGGRDAEAVKRWSLLKGSVDQYRVRFVRHRGNIIADREFNDCNLLNAAKPFVYDGKGGSFTGQLVCSWRRENPNIFTASTPSASATLERKVTKRSVTQEPAGVGTLETSEYFRTAVARPSDMIGAGVPVLGAVREKWRFRVAPDGLSIDALFLETHYDPTASGNNQEPEIVLSYKVAMRKLN